MATRMIARKAEKQIRNKTGMTIQFVLAPVIDTRSPECMMTVIARSLDMDPSCYRIRSRARDIAELRFIAALFLRENYPTLTLQRIARLFGGQDHSSVVSGIGRAHDLICTGDPRFISKYNSVLKSVDQWLGKDMSGYVSAYSA